MNIVDRPNREKIMKPEEFDLWFDNAKYGDRIVYYRGFIMVDTHVESLNHKVWNEYKTYENKLDAMHALRKLATHVLHKFGVFKVLEKSSSITKHHTLELVQKKIRPTRNPMDSYYEYIAVRI